MAPSPRKHEASEPNYVLVDQQILESIRDGLFALKDAIEGNRLGNPGLAKRVDALETSEKAITHKFILWGGIFTGIGFALQYIKSLFK